MASDADETVAAYYQAMRRMHELIRHGTGDIATAEQGRFGHASVRLMAAFRSSRAIFSRT